jgi:DNA (cytosine-5)-methyltransferase 1
LVGGFPCQDYSIANTSKQTGGIYGKKGVLFWSIHAILKKKGRHAPKYLLLENVDRLLKSPTTQRGRDFAIMLASLSDLGYIIEWRVINAADYGYPQRRRRVFILAYKEGTKPYAKLKKQKNITTWLHKDGIMAKAFPVYVPTIKPDVFTIEGNLEHISNTFSKPNPQVSPFHNSGVMINRTVHTIKTTPKYKGKHTTLKDILIHDETLIPEQYFIPPKDIPKWKYKKGGKKLERISKLGHHYTYTEGPVTFPDSLDKPSRTIITSEGGSYPSRFKHVIQTKSGRLRRLLPIELERLNGFPDNHTQYMRNGKVTPDAKRAFMMGNGIVVGVVSKVGGILD